METLSSLCTSQALMSRPSSPAIFCTSGSVSFTGFSLKTQAFSKKKQTLSFVKASVAVEQQTQEAKVALIRIGTRGRYPKVFLVKSKFWVSVCLLRFDLILFNTWIFLVYE